MAITIGDAVMRMSLDRGNFKRELKQAERDTKKSFKRMGDSAKKFGSRLKAMRIPLLAVTGILAGMGALALKFAADFEKGMREVNTLINFSERQLSDLSDEVRELSVEFGLNAVDATKALYQAISKGSDPQQALQLLNVAARTAIGGVTDLETAVDGLTSIMNAFGIEQSEVEHVADVLFETMKGGGTTIGELSTSFFQAAPIAAALNVSFEEIAAATAAITLSGVPTRIAMTGLRAAMVALAKPTDEMQDLLEQIGFKSGSAAFATLGLQGTFEALLGAVDNDTDALIAAGLQVESLNAVFGITGEQAEVFAEKFDSIKNATGSMGTAFELMEDTASQRMAKMQASMNELKLVIGDVLLPIVTELVDGIRSAADAFGSLSGPVQTAIISIITVAGVMAALGLIIPPLIAGVALLTTAFAALNLAMVGFVAIGVAIVAVGFALDAMAGTLVNSIKKITTGSDAAINPLEVFKDKMGGLKDAIRDTTQEMIAFDDQSEDTTREIKDRLAEVTEAIEGAGGVTEALEKAAAGVTTFGVEGVAAFKAVTDGAQTAFDAIKAGNDALLAFEGRQRERADNFAAHFVEQRQAEIDHFKLIEEQKADAFKRRQESLRRGLKSTADFEIAEAIRVAETADEALTAAQEAFRAQMAAVAVMPSVSGGFTSSRASALAAVARAARERREAIARGEDVGALPTGADAGAIFGSGGALPPGFDIFRNPSTPVGVIGPGGIAGAFTREGGKNTATIIVQLDGRTIVEAIGQPLVDEIKLKVRA